MARLHVVKRWVLVALVAGLFCLGLISHGFAANDSARGLAWFLCSVMGLLAVPWLVSSKQLWRSPVGGFLTVLLGLAIWAWLQTLPLPTGLGVVVNPVWAESVRAMTDAGVAAPAMIPLAVQPEAAGRAARQCLAMLLFAAGVAALAARGGWRPLALLIALLAVTEGMMGLVMMALHGAGRAYGGVYNPNHHAALVLAGLPLAVALLWNRHERRLLVDGEGLLGGRDIGLMALGFVLAATAGWMGALSRGSILLGAPIVLAWLVWEWWRSNDPEDLAVERWRGPVLSGVVVIMIAGMALGGFGGRLSGGDAEGAAAASSRPELARATLVGLSETRFMGLGLHGAEYAINRHVNFSTRFVPIYTHNDWVQFLAEVGIPGFLILLVCATPAARFAWSNRRMPRRMGLREGRLRRAAMAGLGATVAHGFVDFHLRIPLITMTAVALVVLILSPLDADEWEPED